MEDDDEDEDEDVDLDEMASGLMPKVGCCQLFTQMPFHPAAEAVDSRLAGHAS